MKHSSNLLVDAPAEKVGAILADLGTYPHWNDLVQTAQPDDSAADESDPEYAPAWKTTLRAQVGPLARSKQLRFVRVRDETESTGSRTIRFERDELDGREHAAWTMEARVLGVDSTSTEVTLTLSYTCLLYTSPSPRDRG